MAALSPMDIAGADLTSKVGRKFYSAKDPRHASAPSFSFGGRSNKELDALSTKNAFYCKNGTHRAVNGQSLLHNGRQRNDRYLEELRQEGRQWKATPGPGTYRVPRAFAAKTDLRKEVQLGTVAMPGRTPSWKFSTATRPRVYHTLGGSGHTHEHEGPLRPPTPRNLSPGPGRYYQHCDSCPSLFADFARPQGRQVA